MDTKITEYIAVSETGVDDLNATVNNLLKLGWTPIGGVSTSYGSVTDNETNETLAMLYFSQALVR